ncbi:MarR family winged helix-turn-helix transcriptional regulator [Actinomadura keratinilytica]|jgi:DNA-binding MarR family transcriptional regulator|uniref:HTH marR-type domain-containing protein n=1 Tax=Actinomadura keratinilytica TaxID=547461 RepID=A0ABP7Z1T9_9ACTN
MHGFVFQAIGPDGTTAAELGRRLGVSKQAAGKTVEQLERLGYVTKAGDPADARRKVVRLTDRGLDALARSAQGFDRIRERWERTLGADRPAAVEESLRTMTPDGHFPLDVPGWFSNL